MMGRWSWKSCIAALAVCATQAPAAAQDFDYQALRDNPTPANVGAMLAEVARRGRGSHHFYLTYCTSTPGVVLPPFVRRLHPVEITVVLEWQFQDLELIDDAIHVTVSFGHQPARIEIPLTALTYFSDPTENLEIWLRAGDTSEERCETEAEVA